jgi:hypothetical protein
MINVILTIIILGQAITLYRWAEKRLRDQITEISELDDTEERALQAKDARSRARQTTALVAAACTIIGAASVVALLLFNVQAWVAFVHPG